MSEEEAPATCEECNSKLSKYCCPRCARRTCSLECVRAHKARTDCDGRRNRVAYVPISNFSEPQLRSDYHFLEDAMRCVDGARRERVAVSGETKSRKRKLGGNLGDYVDGSGPPAPPGGADWLLQHDAATQRLVREAGTRKTRLYLLPPGMRRRASNTTRFNTSSKRIHWKVRWEFALPPLDTSASSSAALPRAFALEDDAVSEETLLENALAKHLEPRQGNVPARHVLRHFAALPREQLSVKIAQEWTAGVDARGGSGKAAVEVLLSQTLRAALSDMTILEHPVIRVALATEQEASSENASVLGKRKCLNEGEGESKRGLQPAEQERASSSEASDESSESESESSEAGCPAAVAVEKTSGEPAKADAAVVAAAASARLPTAPLEDGEIVL